MFISGRRSEFRYRCALFLLCVGFILLACVYRAQQIISSPVRPTTLLGVASYSADPIKIKFLTRYCSALEYITERTKDTGVASVFLPSCNRSVALARGLSDAAIAVIEINAAGKKTLKRALAWRQEHPAGTSLTVKRLGWFSHEPPNFETSRQTERQRFDFCWGYGVQCAGFAPVGREIWDRSGKAVAKLVQNFDPQRNFRERERAIYFCQGNCRGSRVAKVWELSKVYPVHAPCKCLRNMPSACEGGPWYKDMEEIAGREASAPIVRADGRGTPCTSKLSTLFYSSMENAPCTGYVSEKLAVGLLSGGIPLVRDPRKLVHYSHRAPPNSYINIDSFDTIEDVGVFLRRIASNYTLYASFHAWRKADRALDILYPQRSSIEGQLCDITAPHVVPPHEESCV
ncbi:unnamed protein product [Amoebophrya sp. A25]|nr:unnamed protein product [Amoebophrya sp. A25]|eukprot:GSA25T00027164001.1